MMLHDQTKSNFERLATWQMRLSVHLVQHVPERQAVLMFGDAGTNGVVQDFDFATKVVMDLRQDSICRIVELSTVKTLTSGSLEPIKFSGAGPVEENSLVTSAGYVHFAPKQRWPAFAVLPNHPAAKNKRAAFLDPSENAKRETSGNLPDPRDFFGLAPNTRVWEDLEFYDDALGGKLGADMKIKADSRIVIEESKQPEGTWYRLRAVMDGPEALTVTSVWDPNAGYHPVYTDTTVNEKVRTRLVIDWHRVSDIYVPRKAHTTWFAGPQGSTNYDRTVLIADSIVNEKLDPQQFGYGDIGMKDGDLVIDNVRRIVQVVEQGTPRKLSGFGEAYQQPEIASGQREVSPLRILLITTSGGLLVLVGAVAVWRRWRTWRRSAGDSHGSR